MVLSEVFAPAGGGPYRPARVDVSFGSDVSVITLAGEVDLAMAEILTDVCNDVLQRDCPVRIDASRLTFIDSSGLGFLTRLVQAAPGGRPPTLFGASRLVLDTIQILGLMDLVAIT